MRLRMAPRRRFRFRRSLGLIFSKTPVAPPSGERSYWGIDGSP